MDRDRGAITHTERTADEIRRNINRAYNDLRELRPKGLPEIVEQEEFRLECLWEELRAALCFERTVEHGHHIESPDLRRNGHGP